MAQVFVAPSLLASDFGNFQSTIELLNRSEADWLHVDIMDGHFVPNITFGSDMVAMMAKHSQKPLDVHLMITEPDRYLEQFVKAGSATLSVHIEACQHLHRTLQRIRDLGAKPGVAINPHTSISQLENVIELVDLVIVMGVNPGFGGQKFIQNTIKKVQQVKALTQNLSNKPSIEVDGGVSLSNAKDLVEAGCDVLVAGNFVFSSEDITGSISALRQLANK